MATTRSPGIRAVLALGIAVWLLSACGGQTGAQTSASASTSPSASVSTASPSASSATATPSTASFALLPESVLADMSPLVYQTPAGGDAAMAAQGARPAVSSVFSGGISREMTYQGKTVGGVELYRFRTEVTADAQAKFVPLMVQSFARLTPTATTLDGVPVQVADGARGTSVTAIGWNRANEVVIIWADGVAAAQQIAQRYLAQTS